MYNRDHRAAAARKGYFGDTEADVRAEVDQRAADRGKDAAWKARTMTRIYRPIDLLRSEPRAWHVGFRITHVVKPWWPKAGPAQVPPAENFLPRPHGGWHFYFPYRHNHHHLISAGAFREYVLDAPAEGQATPFTRRIVILKSGWNINRRENIILLPTEEAVADIAALPAHCPWETRSHPNYSESVKDDLTKVRKAIDKASDVGAHEALEDVELALAKLEAELRKKIARARGPL